MSAKVYLSLGSNIGDRESNIAQATMALSINLDIMNIQSSSFYESQPLYNTEQPKFLNSVVSCDTDLQPFDFFDVTERIEKMLGKKFSPENKWNLPITNEVKSVAKTIYLKK